jgi:hypothetical protein
MPLDASHACEAVFRTLPGGAGPASCKSLQFDAPRLADLRPLLHLGRHMCRELLALVSDILVIAEEAYMSICP